MKNFKSENKNFVIAARFTGLLKSAFFKGKPRDKIREEIREAQIKKGEDVAEDLPHLAKSQGESNILIVADTDILADSSWVRQQNFFGRQICPQT